MFVLPDPVGPVTSTIPYGLEIAVLKRSSECGSKPSLVMSSMSFDLSSSRMTIFSPHRVGSTDTRKSRSRLRSSTFILILMRPSWGSRFSAMSSFAMILTREMSGSRSFRGSAITL